MATGIKRVSPDKVVFTYQGDGDLAAIGTGEVVHAANRAELITTIFINNAVYGMTGGQMAPTTLPGQVTTSSPTGRDVETAGFPMRMAELLAVLPGVGYVTRQSVLDVKGIRQTKRAIKLAFQTQLAGLGFLGYRRCLHLEKMNTGHQVLSLQYLIQQLLPPLLLVSSIANITRKIN